MPGGDGTGPRGEGPMTGRGRFSAGGRGRMGGPFAAGLGGICKCPKCGHKWVCKSKLIYTTCPSCQRKFKIPNSNKK